MTIKERTREMLHRDRIEIALANALAAANMDPVPPGAWKPMVTLDKDQYALMYYFPDVGSGDGDEYCLRPHSVAIDPTQATTLFSHGLRLKQEILIDPHTRPFPRK